MTLSGYQFQSELHRSERSIVERGILHGQSVVLKRLNRQYPLPTDLADYQREYAVLQHIQSDWVIKGYGLNAQRHELILVLEDVEGQSLRQLYREQALPLDRFFDIAIAITQGLSHIHTAQVIHKDINPGNIVFNPATSQLRIIDFGLSSRIQQETATLQHPNTLEGTLNYLSPEQTGRVNRLIDYRTDIYSLGVTFYELLTGSLPFTTTDPMALVHSHLAKMPPSVTELRSDIPDFLAAMVTKMMAKSAEGRYQSAWGIQADLERLQAGLSRGFSSQLPIAQDDYPFQFRLPQTLYGREAELHQLLVSFEESRCSNGSRLVLVTGYSGIGKSALVRELYRPITEAQGYFATGKFDQLQRVVPYAALIRAFSGLLRQLLGESAAQLEMLRSHLLTAVGNNGQVIIDVIPDLELVIGTQSAVPALAPAESQNRFSSVFQRFVRVFAQSEHPLVMFLDDLQWADTASLKLLHLLLSDAQTESLLVIGAYRSNEVSETHPLSRTLIGLQKDGISPTTLTLSPLALPHICQLLVDTLYQDLQAVEPLAQLILEKTGGNPFFVNEFLKTLETEKLIRFHLSQRRWHWELAQIQAQEITDNVVVLMTRKLQKLSSEVQQLLCMAACVGASFDVETLSLVAEQDPAIVCEMLEPALQMGLLLASEQTQALTFLHDRVQQAAYDLLDSGEKSALHLRIGQHLQQQLATLPEKLFEVVDHLNLGRSQLSLEQWLEVAQLNLEAGQRAKQATAYQAAEQYLAVGVECLGEIVAPSLTYDLHREWAEVQYLLGEFDASQSTIDYLLQQNLSPLQQAEVYNLRIVQNTIQTNYQAALEAGKEALAVLGITLPLTDLEVFFKVEYAELRESLEGRTLASLGELPTITEPEKIFAVELLSNLGSAAYRYDRRVWQMIVVLSINLFLKYGNVPQSCYGYSNYGTLLGSVLGDYQAGYESARLSLQLSEHYCDRTQTSRACFILSNFVQSWVRPVSEADAINQAGVDAGLETGEFQYVGYTLSYRISNLFFQGKPLSEVMAALQEAMQFCRQVKNQWAIDALLGYQLTIQQLLGESSGIDPSYIQACHDNNSLSGLCRYYILQGLALYLDRQPTEALAMLEKATPMLDFILGVVSVAEYHFYRAILLAELPVSSDTLQQLETHRTWLHQRAAICPDNFLQKAQLIDAELARLKGQQWDAIQHYDAAITCAVSHQFLQDEAIACERAALFWLDYDKQAFAQPYLQQAHYAFMRWGTAHKVAQLEQEFPWLQSINDLELNPAAITKRISGNTFSDTLDLSSLLKASQTISSEIVLERLTRELMEILVENAGAQQGYLLLKDGATLRIAAHSGGGGDVPEAVSASDPNQLPLSLINYVARTEQAIVLNDAATAEDFVQDPYIRAHQPKSIFCVPLLHQGNLNGLVYFEHFLAPNAFTRDRLEVIVLLSSQAAISIQNAQLYNTLEQKVVQRTQALAAERAKSEKLLHNILPVAIAERLKENEQAIADGFEEVSVLFCDIVGFTGLSSQISPTELVDFLNQIFSVFDQLCDHHQLEKIKTVGDAYLVVGGLPGSAVDHGNAIANMALDMVQSLRSLAYPGGTPLQVRIGIHMGPVVAGVIGTKKFAYDLWGDTVNVASRMESQGAAGKIQVTPTVHGKLAQRYTFERRGTIAVKGKGKMTTYWLTGKKSAP
ncbi:MAG: adenylate/guanylate cyclase domain-containing protein [Cyanobacteria bacterium P01_B01_bin.77]